MPALFLLRPLVPPTPSASARASSCAATSRTGPLPNPGPKHLIPLHFQLGSSCDDHSWLKEVLRRRSQPHLDLRRSGIIGKDGRNPLDLGGQLQLEQHCLKETCGLGSGWTGATSFLVERGGDRTQCSYSGVGRRS